jgi:multidrug efflux pump subunit AcrA (membrane-fusion protein)
MKRLFTGVFFVAVILGIIWWQRASIAPYVVRSVPATAAYIDRIPGAKPADTKSKPPAGPAAVPVSTASVAMGDFPVYLNGLGSVQPYDTVTVRSRVDGQITQVLFRQGQMVSDGDMLVQIDPRPYQAALDQAKAKKAQDDAQQRPAEPGTVYDTGKAGLRHTAAIDHPAISRRAIEGADPGRPGHHR